MIRGLPPALLLLCLCAPLFGGGARAAEPGGGIQLRDLRIPEPAGNVAALYLRILDRGAMGDRLLEVRTPVAAHTMLHRTRRQGDRVHMVPAPDGIPVPAGGEARLAPGGAHAMLMGLRRPLHAGERVPVRLRFERAGVIAAQATVVPLVPAAPHGTGGGARPQP